MKKDVAFCPLAIGLFRAKTIMPNTQRIAHLIQQARRTGRKKI